MPDPDLIMPTTTDLSDADPSALSMEAALSRLREHLPVISEQETLELSQAFGRVAAQSLPALIDTPPFRSSAMDGYAIRHAEAHTPLRIVGSSMAGHPGPDFLPTGGCQRITTGARVPDDADTVVMQENTTISGGLLTIEHLPMPGFNVRISGSDVKRGTSLLRPGERLSAANLGLLEACGHTQVKVVRALRVAILSTGDELIDAGATLAPGQIHDANRVLLTTLLKDPGIEIVDAGICQDSVDALQDALKRVSDADLIVSSGGVSVGDADFVRQVIDQQGSVALWKIAMKPGRPLSFGLLDAHRAWIGLPGNPVSAAVTCLMFVHPAVRYMTGQPEPLIVSLQARLTGQLRKLPGRVEYQRGVLEQNLDEEWQVSTTGAQDSHVLTSLSKANCFVELPLESSGAETGEWVKVIPFSSFTQGSL